ncbi:MAG TPA: arginase family protein [Saprospiraceae bacterium]|nr:arginase family protein [Saprospiraceae bacterium]
MPHFSHFNPDEAHEANGNFAGLPHAGEEASIFYLPIPWDATTSGRKGTSQGPENILRQSLEIDLFDPQVPRSWSFGHQFLEIDHDLLSLNNRIRGMVENHRENQIDLHEINESCAAVNEYVFKEVSKYLSSKRLITLIGGEHSLSLGSIRAHLQMYPDMNVVQLDAHMDLRRAYEGLKYSHASVFYNVLNNLPLKGLFQIGVRDFCSEEWDRAQGEDCIHSLTAEEIFKGKARGRHFEKQLNKFLEPLAKEVYLSLDIDVLEPHLCPGTGTPVPGGLAFWDIMLIVDFIQGSGRKIVGFDLVETGGEAYVDGFTAAKLLYNIAGRVLNNHVAYR